MAAGADRVGPAGSGLERRYEAVVAAAEAASTDPRSRRFRTITQARAAVATICAEDGFGRRWPGVTEVIVVRRRSGATTSFASTTAADRAQGVLPATPVIALAVLDQATVLHELAHVCVGLPAGHGPAFAAALCQLVRRVMGFDAYGELVAGFESSALFAGLAGEVLTADSRAGPW